MKTSISFSTLVLVIATAVSSTREKGKGTGSPEQLGQSVFLAFRNHSAEEYKILFPSLDELHQLMDDNADMYKVFIDIAKEDFAKVYQSKVLPDVERAFDAVFNEGHLYTKRDKVK